MSQGPSAPSRARYMLDPLGDRDRLYLMFDVLHDSFLDDISKLFQHAGVAPDRPWRLLEVACGEGLHVVDLAQRHPSGQFVAFDRDAEAVQTASKAFAHIPSIQFLHQDAHDPLPDSVARGFDLVQMRFCLTHLTDPVRALKHLYDAMRPGGAIYLVDPPSDVFDFSHPSMAVLNDAVFGMWRSFGTTAAGDRQPELLEKAGFRVVENIKREHATHTEDRKARGMLQLDLETLSSMRRAITEVAKSLPPAEFDEHLLRLRTESDQGHKGVTRIRSTFAVKPA